MATTRSRGLGRRSLLAAAGAVAGSGAINIAGSGAISGFPTIWAQNIKNITLRQFGTGVSNLNAVADKVKADLGFTLTMTALDTDAVTQKAVTQPKSYDIADIEYFAIKKVFPTGVMQPMDAKKIKLYDKIVPIFTKGRLTPDSPVGQGTTPYSVGYVDGPNGKTFAKGATGWMTPDQQLEGPRRPRVQG
jgi:putative spermidine/putrescine transport system substrate-binding protein